MLKSASLVLLCALSACGQTTVGGSAKVAGSTQIGMPLIEANPPMGWNSWLYSYQYYYPASGWLPTEAYVKAMSDYLVATPGGLCSVQYIPPGGSCLSLAALGYTLVSVDAGWMQRTGSVLQSVPAQFPDGMAATAAYVHADGLKLGLYGTPGTPCIPSTPDQYGHEASDAVTVAGFGVDYWKHDLCSATDQWGSTNADIQAAYQAFGTALVNTGRSIAYHVNAYAAYNSVQWSPVVSGTSSRIGSDNDNVQWYKKAQSLDGETWATWATYQRKGYWLDPDCLMFQLDENFQGTAGVFTEIVGPGEGQSQFNWYAMIAAPLIVGTDLTVLNSASLASLSNREVIAVDQDPLGVMGTQVATTSCGSATCAVWVRRLVDGYAIAFFNFDPAASHNIPVTWAQAGISGTFNMRDLWAHASVGSSATGYTASVPAFTSGSYSSVILKLTRGN